jgi:hypothetical protein
MPFTTTSDGERGRSISGEVVPDAFAASAIPALLEIAPRAGVLEVRFQNMEASPAY